MSYRAGILFTATVLSCCAIDPDDLPDVQEHPPVLPVREALEIPLDRISLALAAEDGNTDMIAALYSDSGEIRWLEDGAVAVKLCARRGHADVVELLLTYGACSDFASACFEALDVARMRNHFDVVLQLQAALSPHEDGRW